MMASQSGTEHRRGLVLGLTLAEVMLLVLFLLLLGFGSLFARQTEELVRLRRTGHDAGMLKDRVERLQPLIDAINRRSPGAVRDVNDLLEHLRRVEELEITISLLSKDKSKAEDELSSLRKQLPTDEKEQKRLAELINRASKLDLRDPVSVLTRALVGEEENLRKQLDELRLAAEKRQREANEMAEKIAAAEKRLKDSGKGHNLPPLIVLSEADGFFFESGKAELSEPFKAKLTSTIVPRVLEQMKLHQVNVIEVVGHTDPVPMRGRATNLDDELLSFFNDDRTDIILEASDNPGLGMARAAAVVRYLRMDERLRIYRGQILPLSSGQVLEVSGLLSDDSNIKPIRERRRIEIRLRRPGAPQ